MNPSANTTTASEELAHLTHSSDQPLTINDTQITKDNRAIVTASGSAITVTDDGHWQHQGDVKAVGPQWGLFISQGSADITGHVIAQSENNKDGIWIEKEGRLTIKGDTAASANIYAGLRFEGSHFKQEGALNTSGKTYGAWMSGGTSSIEGDTVALGTNNDGIHLYNAQWTLKGNLDAQGGVYGVYAAEGSQIDIKSPEKIAISGQNEGLRLINNASCTSEGPMVLQANRDAALSMNTADFFNHNGTLEAQGKTFGVWLSSGSATLHGKTVAYGENNDGVCLKNSAKLTITGVLEAQGKEGYGIATEGSSQLVFDGSASLKGKKTGLWLYGGSAKLRGNLSTQGEQRNGVTLENAAQLQHFSNEESYIHKLKTILGHHLN